MIRGFFMALIFLKVYFMDKQDTHTLKNKKPTSALFKKKNAYVKRQT
jgi:hypothetical protein